MNKDRRIRVFSVDDHPLLREGVAALVNNQKDMVLAGEAPTGAEAIEMFRTHLPDVTLMDLRLPDMSGIDTLIAIRTEFPDARVIMLTTFEGDVEIHRALQAGARGYLLKNMPPSEILDMIRQVHAGKKRVPPEIASQIAEHMGEEQLTEREVEVLRAVAEGNRNRDIAEKLFISEETVKVHIKHIMEAGRYGSHSGSRHRRASRNNPAINFRMAIGDFRLRIGWLDSSANHKRPSRLSPIGNRKSKIH